MQYLFSQMLQRFAYEFFFQKISIFLCIFKLIVIYYGFGNI